MKRRVPVLLAFALLVVAGAIDSWDWWSSHDVEILSLFQKAPILGDAVRASAGEEYWHDHIVIAVDASYPPFASLDSDGKMVGFEVDLASELGRRLSNGPALLNMDAGDALFDALASKKVDAIVAGLTYYPEITRDVAYSDPYFEAGPVLLTRLGRPDISGAGDLMGKKVAVELGSLGEDVARGLQRDHAGMMVTPMDDVEHVMGAVVDGGADAAIVDRPAIPPGALASMGLAPVGPPLRSQPYMVAVQRKNRALLLAINRVLDAMKVDGSLAAMESRWFR